jgi:hypothetical protein
LRGGSTQCVMVCNCECARRMSAPIAERSRSFVTKDWSDDHESLSDEEYALSTVIQGMTGTRGWWAVGGRLRLSGKAGSAMSSESNSGSTAVARPTRMNRFFMTVCFEMTARYEGQSNHWKRPKSEEMLADQCAFACL